VDSVTVRELRNQGGDVINRVVAGESLIVTRAGTPVAELRPLRRPPLERSVLLARWRRLPHLDADKLREDIDAVIDQSL
jgi:prevent-host-death family protein